MGLNVLSIKALMAMLSVKIVQFKKKRKNSKRKIPGPKQKENEHTRHYCVMRGLSVLCTYPFYHPFRKELFNFINNFLSFRLQGNS